MIGKTLGHYQITSQLGKGGMGEVFQAKDQILGRDVAIKVLPDEFAKDADRVARFQREAKVLASLNHPNIAAIHGLEESGGTNFLVLELVEGDTLADRIKAGPIPVEESLKLALQIAEALEAAHEKGVIHRDLKPANIKVTPEGKVKVLDFGLAKAYAGDREQVNLSNSPTLSEAATQQGIILGTAAYMSPEQARGEAVDKKADIWAFGCVLFEMLSGCRMFEGRTVSDTLASVLKSEPEWKRLPPNIHPRIRLLLERCLEKEAKNRCSGIGEARADIQKALADPSGVFVQPIATVEPRTKLRTVLPWLIAILGIIVGGIAVWNLKRASSPEPRRVIRLHHDLSEDQQFSFSPRRGHTLAVSPDGSQFVYSTSKGLYLRSVDELNAGLIDGTAENPQSPFFSPDGQWIGYWSQADKKLKKIAIRGGVPVTLCDVTQVMGAIWYTDNTIVYSDVPKGIMRVSANGGTPETLVKGISTFPQLLPDGKSLIFTDPVSRPARIMVQSLVSGERKELFAGRGAHYLSTGHLVYELQNSLLAVLFNPNTLEMKSGPVALIEGVTTWMYAFSNSGTLVYLPGTPAPPASANTLVWVDRNGKEEPLGTPPNQYLFPKISPDGTRVALTIQGDNPDIWIWDLARRTMTRLTFDRSRDTSPVWTPDGKKILFYSEREGKFGGIYRKSADGAGGEEKLASASDRSLFPYDMSSDGKFLVMAETVDGAIKWDIGMLSMEGDHARKPLMQNDEYIETQPKISPDGKWMAYSSGESGINEVYVRPFPEANKGRWQVSTNSGNSPLWSPNGRELFYFSDADNSVMAAAVETGPGFSVATPRKLFPRGQYFIGTNTPGTPWDIHPDGKRFLMIRQPGPPPTAAEIPRRINIVLNWTEELKQRVPVK